MSILSWCVRNRWKTVLIGGGGAFVATIFAFATLPMTFQPTIDQDYSQVQIEMVPGSTLEQTRNVTRQVASMVERRIWQGGSPGQGAAAAVNRTNENGRLPVGRRPSVLTG